MASVNKVIIVGNLGKDPEVRYAPSGAAICNITVATSRQWKDKTSGERQEETEWHRVVSTAVSAIVPLITRSWVEVIGQAEKKQRRGSPRRWLGFQSNYRTLASR